MCLYQIANWLAKGRYQGFDNHKKGRRRPQPKTIMSDTTSSVVSSVTGAPVITEEALSNWEETAKRVAKDDVFGKMQFVVAHKVMEAGGTVMKVVMKKLGVNHNSQEAIQFWNKTGKKIVERHINRRRQVVMSVVKKRFIGKAK